MKYFSKYDTSSSYLTAIMSSNSHNFEEIIGETPKIYNFDEEGSEENPVYTVWSEKRLPMALFKPFGYSACPTQLMTVCFWLWLLFGFFLHAWTYMSSKKIREAEASIFAEIDGVKIVDERMETAEMDEKSLVVKAESSTDEENNLVGKARSSDQY